MERVKEYSVREEVRIALEETLEENHGLTVDEVMDIVENDELMINMISYSIYKAIQEKLKEKGIKSDEVYWLVDADISNTMELMYSRGIL